MIVKVTNIKWDTDNKNVNIPTELDVTVPDNITDPFDIECFISDEISNITGWCHQGFTLPELDQ